MRTLVVAATLVLLSAAPAFADGDLTCKGSADGANHSSVEVDFTVDNGSGATTDREITWSPPTARQNPMGLFNGTPQMSIEYDHATGSGMGAPTKVSVVVLNIGVPGSLSDADLVLTIDGRPWSIPLNDVSTRTPLSPRGGILALGVTTLADSTAPGGPLRPDLLDAVEKAQSITVEAMGRHGRVGSPRTYDLSDHAARNALFPKAWADAVAATAHPDDCDDGSSPTD